MTLNLFTLAMLCLFVASLLFSAFWIRPRKQELIEEYGEWRDNPVSVSTAFESPVEHISLNAPSLTALNAPSFGSFETLEVPKTLSVREAGSEYRLPHEIRHYVWISRLTLAVMVVSGCLFIFCLSLINQ